MRKKRENDFFKSKKNIKTWETLTNLLINRKKIYQHRYYAHKRERNQGQKKKRRVSLGEKVEETS